MYHWSLGSAITWITHQVGMDTGQVWSRFPIPHPTPLLLWGRCFTVFFLPCYGEYPSRPPKFFKPPPPPPPHKTPQRSFAFEPPNTWSKCLVYKSMRLVRFGFLPSKQGQIKLLKCINLLAKTNFTCLNLVVQISGPTQVRWVRTIWWPSTINL